MLEKSHQLCCIFPAEGYTDRFTGFVPAAFPLLHCISFVSHLSTGKYGFFRIIGGYHEANIE